MSLSDAATASDALDEQLAERLGPAPEQGTSAPASATGPGPRRSHHGARRGPTTAAKTVTAAQLVPPIKGSLGLLTFFFGLVLCGFNFEDWLVDVVTMDAEEAEAIAKPGANMLAGQKWFREYGQHLVNADDGIAFIYGVVNWAGRVAPAIRQHAAERPHRERSKQAARVFAGSPEPSSNGHQPSGFSGLSGAYTAD